MVELVRSNLGTSFPLFHVLDTGQESFIEQRDREEVSQPLVMNEASTKQHGLRVTRSSHKKCDVDVLVTGGGEVDVLRQQFP